MKTPSPDAMKMIAFRVGSVLGWALFGPLFAGCWSDNTPSTCNEGTLRCACYPNSGNYNGLCQEGLVCVSNVCVAATDASVSTAPDASLAPDATTPDASQTSSDVSSMSDVSLASEVSNGSDASQTADGSQAAEESGSQGNLVTNGNFAITTSGNDYWGIVAGSGTLTVMNGMGCVAVPASQSATLGWPEAPNSTGPNLSTSASYTLSYTASATSAITVDAKVGWTMSPYYAIFETPSDMVGTSPTTFTHPFSAAGDAAVEMGDMSAGIAFAFSAGASGNMVCFQNISLIEN